LGTAVLAQRKVGSGEIADQGTVLVAHRHGQQHLARLYLQGGYGLIVSGAAAGQLIGCNLLRAGRSDQAIRSQQWKCNGD
jgi:hypothetical protein